VPCGHETKEASVRKLAIAVAVLMFLCLATVPTAFADNSGFQDWGFNTNGTWSCGALCGSTITAVSGVSVASFNQNTGLGTITYTSTAGGYFGAWIFDDNDVTNGVNYDEYGATGGTAASGQSWQIDLPDYEGPDTNHNGTIIANSMGGTLSNTNLIPGTASNYLGSCSTGADCDDITSLAMGFNLGAAAPAGEEYVVTLTLSETAPAAGTFFLEQIEPANSSLNGSLTNAVDIYMTGAVTLAPVCVGPNCGVTPPPPGVPEPNSLLLLGSGISVLGLFFRRRIAG
jgi:PEP-CTERM motif-containing protein